MRSKSSGIKSSTICEECLKLTRKADLYQTIEKPKCRWLCNKCFWIWIDITPPRSKA
jgi:hypothetical protein